MFQQLGHISPGFNLHTYKTKTVVTHALHQSAVDNYEAIKRRLLVPFTHPLSGTDIPKCQMSNVAWSMKE